MAITVPVVTDMRTRPSREGLDYLRPAQVDHSGLVQGIQGFARGVAALASQNDEDMKKSQRFDALNKLTQFQIDVDDSLQNQKDSLTPGDLNFRERADQSFNAKKATFINSLPPELREEFNYRADQIRLPYTADVEKYNGMQLRQFGKQGIDSANNQAKIAIDKDPASASMQILKMDEIIDNAPGYSDAEKMEIKRENRRMLRGLEYKKDYLAGRIEGPGDGTIKPGSQADIINQAAQQLGINPVELATVISYETGGTFSTSIRGGKKNRYIGLIQFGPNEQAQYGARQGQSFEEQMGAVVRYLKDRGLKPGMGIRDIYSTINAGSPGLYNRSDRPGMTVDTHVQEMVNGAHGKKAEALMGGKLKLDAIDDDPRFVDVPYEDRLAIRKDAEAEATRMATAMEAQRTEQHNAFMNELYNGLYDGRMGQQQIDDAIESGELTDFDERKKAQDILEKRNEDGNLALSGQEKLASGGVWDPTDERDKKMQNAMIGDSGIAKLNKLDKDYATNVVVSNATITQDIPTRVTGLLTGMMRDNDPKKALFALDLLAQLRDTAPEAFANRIPDAVESDVQLWSEMKDFMPQDELLRKIKGGMTAEERNASKQYREDAMKLFTDKKNPNYIDFRQVLTDMAPHFLGVRTGAVPELPGIAWAARRAEADFQTLFIDEYAKYNGDANLAKAAAEKRFSKYWTVSDIGGVPTLTKYAPQTTGYRPVMGSYDYIDEQVRREAGLGDDVKFQLIGDDQTKNEFARWQNGLPAPTAMAKLGASALPGTLGRAVEAGMDAAFPNPRPASYKVVYYQDGQWKAVPKRMWFQVPEELRQLENDKFARDQDEKIAKDYYWTTYEPANRAFQEAGIPIPDEVYQKMEDLTSRFEASDDIFKANQKTYEKMKAARKPGADPKKYPADKIWRPRAIGR